MVASWDDQFAGFWDDAIRGNSPLRAAVLRSLRVEAGKILRFDALGVLWTFQPSLTPLKSFLDETSLHGWKYLNKDGTSVASRVLWMIVLIVSILASAYTICDNVRNFQSATTTTSIDTIMAPISVSDYTFLDIRM